jgi:hypothetical protein
VKFEGEGFPKELRRTWLLGERALDKGFEPEIYCEDIHDVRDSDEMFRVVLETCLTHNAMLVTVLWITGDIVWFVAG